MKKFLIIALTAMMLLVFTGCDKPKEETYKITVWVSESEGVKELTEQQIARFCEENGVTLDATVEGISEADSATVMITSVEDGADIFCFSQDQLSRLVQAGALQVLGEAASATVTELNDEISVKAATVNGQLYCYPLTSDNGYFMYYDKSVVKEEHLDSLEDIIADCEAAGRLFSMELETSAWYNASFFFATGAVSEWVTDESGAFVSVNDTFNSEAGIIALKGMQKLLKSPVYNSSSNAADFSAAIPSAVLISGTWAVSDVKAALGDNFGATDLPSFTVDGVEYHLGSFSGNKLMGVKPQTDANKAALLQKLALYLTNEKCQTERFELKGWGPSNLAAQQLDAVKSDIALAALNAQNAYATPQGQIHGSWWNIALAYATSAKEATTDAELQAALDSYKQAIDALFALDTSGLIFVGAWNGWNNTDDAMRMEKDNETFTITVEVPESDYMGGRIVTPGEWDNDKGVTAVTVGVELIQPADAEGNPDNNIIFLAAGTYEVSYNATTGEISIVQK
ncbi:MAG: extracellular solute-binding protein [Bacillota bacterium]|jgi:arabinogalactan oligomer/maltooligosaccharide transport system substrate-binding protein|nr:extracellular solute-binding protein [Bacillota bacterium]NLL27015.1 extracellular solute-binding protein [Erysipelotrichia bacterium]